MIKKTILGLIRIYQKLLVFRKLVFRFLGLVYTECRFKQSCSEYAYQSISKYGIIQGGWRAIKRVSRCHS